MKRMYWFFPLCIMNSNLYNPHLHLYTGDHQEAGEECTYVCNGSSHLQYVIARKYGTSQFYALIQM